MSLQILGGESLFFASLCSYFNLTHRHFPVGCTRGSRGKLIPFLLCSVAPPMGREILHLIGEMAGSDTHLCQMGVNRIKSAALTCSAFSLTCSENWQRPWAAPAPLSSSLLLGEAPPGSPTPQGKPAAF